MIQIKLTALEKFILFKLQKEYPKFRLWEIKNMANTISGNRKANNRRGHTRAFQMFLYLVNLDLICLTHPYMEEGKILQKNHFCENCTLTKYHKLF